jgi:L-fuculose-phosphate aldolase
MEHTIIADPGIFPDGVPGLSHSETASGVIMSLLNEYEMRLEMCRVGKLLHNSGFVAGCDGNISVRLERNVVLSTPTSVCKGMMEPQDLVLVNMEGGLLDGTRNVSSEIAMHLLFYRMRDDVRAVVHAHPPTATGFAASGIALDEPLVAEVVISFGEIPLAPYATPGTPGLSDALRPFIPGHDAILMANHGVVTCGHDLLNAYMKMDKVEHYARIVLVSRQLGTPRPLRSHELRSLQRARENYQGNKVPVLSNSNDRAAE